MTDREIIEAVQTWFNNKCVSSISPEQYDTDNPKISIVRRMINSWKIFCDDKCTGMDFECALRNYLLSFGTDIIIPGYVPENNNKFGLLSEQDSGRVFINYDFPDYINKEFADSVFRMEKGEHNIRNAVSAAYRDNIRTPGANKMSRFHRKPTTKQFLMFLADYVRHSMYSTSSEELFAG